ncbi:uncharacterized protein DUF3558 [Prauserella muralis]|nr:uncharacterized protein DUF3558 [Prauserella muralis]
MPPVDRPLNIDDFLRSPCAALTKQQIDAFLGPSATAKPDPAASTGPDCRWGTDMRHARIYVIFPRVSERGLAAVYQNHDEKYDFFREMPLAAGYPSVAYGVTDNRGEGECTVRVGVSDRDTVDITLYLSDNKVGQLDPCEAAHEVATAVVGNIKARN